MQRWERELALPVRRPKGRSKGVVLVLAEDIDDWLRQQHEPQRDSFNQELERLRAALAELKAENQALRTQLSLGSGPLRLRDVLSSRSWARNQPLKPRLSCSCPQLRPSGRWPGAMSVSER